MKNTSFVEQWDIEQPKSKPASRPNTSKPLQPGTDSPYGKKALETAVQKTLEAPDGEKRLTLLKMSRLVGGYIAGGMLDEETAFEALKDAIDARDCGDYDAAHKAIREGIEYGKKEPIDAEQIESEHKAYAEANGNGSSPDPRAKRPPKQPEGAAPQEHDYAEILRVAEIDAKEDLPPPPVCLTFVQDNQQITIGTLGNLSMIIGKAKSRKTFFVAILLASWIRNGVVLDKVQGNLPAGRRTILHFDTEQGRYHAQLTQKRALRLAEGAGHGHYRLFGLRRFAPDVRLGAIEHAIYEDATVGAVVIDGIRDLASLGINDEAEATDLTSRLLRWTEERQIHVVVVLHQNKNDLNARGHLGTELVNKAETVLSVAKESKDNNYSNVQAEYCRDIEPDPFLFFINREGLPALLNQPENKPADPPKKDFVATDIPKDIHLLALSQAFSKQDKLGYNDLVHQERKDRQFLYLWPIIIPVPLWAEANHPHRQLQ